jgi:hypothetical protein
VADARSIRLVDFADTGLKPDVIILRAVFGL